MKPKDPKKLKVGEIVQYIHYDYDDDIDYFEYYKILSIDRDSPIHAMLILENIKYPFGRKKYYYASYSTVGLQRANALVKLGYLQQSHKLLYRLKRSIVRTFSRTIRFYKEEIHDLLLVFVIGVGFVSACLIVVGLILIGIVYPFIN